MRLSWQSHFWFNSTSFNGFHSGQCFHFFWGDWRMQAIQQSIRFDLISLKRNHIVPPIFTMKHIVNMTNMDHWLDSNMCSPHDKRRIHKQKTKTISKEELTIYSSYIYCIHTPTHTRTYACVSYLILILQTIPNL